jgi:hypothetical protein
MDRTAQTIYGKGIKAYQTKNEWQAWFASQKNNLFNKAGNLMEQLDVPVQGKQKPQEEKKKQDPKAPSENNNSLTPLNHKWPADKGAQS